MELADQYEATVLALKDLARELRIRSVTTLLQAARGRVPGANCRLAALALEDSVSRRVLAPASRSTQKSMAEAPDSRLQTDLIDFSRNTRNTKDKYALMLTDVYTKEARAVPILNKCRRRSMRPCRSCFPLSWMTLRILRLPQTPAESSVGWKRAFQHRQCTERNEG